MATSKQVFQLNDAVPVGLVGAAESLAVSVQDCPPSLIAKLAVPELVGVPLMV